MYIYIIIWLYENSYIHQCSVTLRRFEYIASCKTLNFLFGVFRDNNLTISFLNLSIFRTINQYNMYINVQLFVVRITVESYKKTVTVNQYGLRSTDIIYIYRGLVLGGAAPFTRSTETKKHKTTRIIVYQLIIYV